MSPKKCAAGLRQYNRWRRCEDWPGKAPMPNPRELGLLIDAAIKHLEQIKTKGRKK